jgi:NAD(P)-dependent dehydrogenase (short-subunit alcohol dehydrogenase family)
MSLLDNKRVVITGGGTGIGKGIVMRFVEEGARVCFSYRSSKKGADNVLGFVKEGGGQAAAFHADLEHPEQGVKLINNAVQEMGGIDVLVNNAGLTITKEILDVTEEDWDRIHTIDLKSAFFCSQAAVRFMKSQGGGKIIFISSVHASQSIPQFAPYAAAKGGVEALVRQMAVELAKHNININCVSPGLIEVESYFTDFPWYSRDKFAAKVPIGRVGLPEDVAAIVTFLASEQSGFITGQTISVDGGQLARLGFSRPDI